MLVTATAIDAMASCVQQLLTSSLELCQQAESATRLRNIAWNEDLSELQVWAKQWLPPGWYACCCCLFTLHTAA